VASLLSLPLPGVSHLLTSIKIYDHRKGERPHTNIQASRRVS